MAFHPGFYRVALAVNSRDELPPDPEAKTQAGANGPRSVSGAIHYPPSPPVLADGLFQHIAPLSAKQRIARADQWRSPIFHQTNSPGSHNLTRPDVGAKPRPWYILKQRGNPCPHYPIAVLSQHSHPLQPPAANLANRQPRIPPQRKIPNKPIVRADRADLPAGASPATGGLGMPV
jgi:hypothetical protein